MGHVNASYGAGGGARVVNDAGQGGGAGVGPRGTPELGGSNAGCVAIRGARCRSFDLQKYMYDRQR